jgi:hypothetical protein
MQDGVGADARWRRMHDGVGADARWRRMHVLLLYRWSFPEKSCQ